MQISIEQVIQPVPLTISPDTPIREAIALMVQQGLSYVLIEHGQQLQGIFTERDLVRLIASGYREHDGAIADVMTPDMMTYTVTEQADIFSIFQQMRRHRIRHLPVVNPDQTLHGIITLSSIRQALRPEHLLRFRRVDEAMVQQVVCAHPTDTLNHLTCLMSHNRVSCVVIVPSLGSESPATDCRSTPHPIGIVTERDILQLQLLGIDVDHTHAAEVMSAPLTTVFPNDTLWFVHERMQRFRVRRVVVVDDAGRLVGIVSQSDILRILDPVELYSLVEMLQRSLHNRTTELAQEKQHRQDSEHQRQHSEARLALALELSGTGLWDVDLASGDASWNADHARLMGLVPNTIEASYQTWMNQIHPDDRPDVQAALAEAIENRVDWEAEYRVMLPGGIIRWVWIRGRPLCDIMGQVNHIVGVSLDITNRKRMEEALKRSEAQNRAVLSAIPDLMLLLDRDGHYIEVIRQSDTLNNCFDHLPNVDNPFGKHFTEILPVATADKFVPAFQAAIATGNVQSYEQELIVGDRRQYEDVRISPADDETVLVIVRDISNRKTLELEALRESDARFQEIAHTIDQKFFIRSIKTGQFLYVSPAYEKIYGRSCASLYTDPDSWMDAVHPDDREQVKVFVDQQLMGQPGRCEFRIIRGDGVTRWLFVQTKVIWDESGCPDRVVGLEEDITERKAQEQRLKQTTEALKASENRLKKAQQVAHVGDWDVDIATGAITWSEETYRLIGIDPDQPTPTRAEVLQLIHPDDRHRVEAAIDAAINHGAPYRVEYRLTRVNDGKTRYFLSTGEAICNDQGTVIRQFGIFMDITEQKLTEQALRASEARNRAILEAFPDLLVRYRRNGDLIDFVFPTGENAKLYIPFSNSVREVLSGENLTIVLQAIETAIHTNTVQIRELSFEKPGRLAHEEIRIARIDDDEVLVVARDITDRKRLELALRESEAKLSDILNSAIASIMSYEIRDDGSWDYIYCSVGCEAIFGYTADEMRSDKTLWHSRIPESDRQMFQTIFFNHPLKETVQHYEFRFRHKSGELRWISSSISFRQDSANHRWVATVVDVDITNRKQTELALRESQQQLESIAANIPGMIFREIFHPDGRNIMLYLSGYEQVLMELDLSMSTSISPEEKWNQIYSLVHPDDRQGLRDYLASAAQTLHPVNYEYRIITPSGEVKWLKEWSRYYRLDNGEVMGDGVILDISDRKRTEMALRQSQAKLQLITDSVSAGIAYIDADQRYQFVNKTFERWFSKPGQGLIGKTVHELLGDDAYAVVKESIEWVLAGHPVTEERQIQCADGINRFIVSDLVPDISDGGQGRGYYALMTDISDRKAAEREIESQRNFLQQVIDAIPSIVFVKDPQGRYLLANKAAAAILGQSSETVLNKCDTDFCINPHQAAAFLANNARVMESLQTQVTPDEYIVNHIGDGHWYQTTISPFIDPQGNVQGIIGNAVDISDRKKIEESLQKSLEEKNILLSEVHHRVKNNLQVIVSLLNLQSLRLADPAVCQILEHSGDRIHAMALVHEKLYRTQHFEGIMLSDYIRDFVDQMIQSYESLEPLPDTSAIVHYCLDDSIGLKLDQAIQFSLILNELVTNALKHGKSDDRTEAYLYITLTKLEHPHHAPETRCEGIERVQLRVGNRGDTLPTDFSLTASRQSMGLQLVQVLAAQINGTLNVQRGDITWFELNFPIPHRSAP